MRIYLIGFMGCGKSSLGRRLADKLNYTFFDTDTVLEEKAGMKVPEIFSQLGEETFRELEAKVLRETASVEQVVVATGGGMPCYFDNMDFMLQNGKTIYIRMDPTSLADRIENSHKKRPLVDHLKGDALIQTIKEKLALREPYYLKAECIVKGESLKPKHVISLIFGENSFPDS